ncbi:MAG TPA: hypothetical protein VHB73_04790 [Alphaproteobacteria bacterium]|nr:hypothetical protein [Alphaproteobacteria bacterium]
MSVRLPVLATVLAAWRDVFADFPATLRALSLIFAVLMVFTEVPLLFISNYVHDVVTPAMAQTEKADSAPAEAAASTPADRLAKISPATRAGVLLGALALYTLQMVLVFGFMYAWYHQLLTGENKGKPIRPRFGKNEWRLMWTSVKVGFALLPVLFFAVGVVTAAYPTGDVKAAPAFSPWPPLVILLIIGLYVQARTALAYPATVASENDAPFMESWTLTRKQALPLALGNVLVEVPFFAGMYLLFLAIAWALGLVLPVPEEGKELGGPLLFAVQLFLKAVGQLSVLLFVALLSAFHARAYAYLVRASSNTSSA